MRGSGYKIEDLRGVLARVIGRGREWNLALVGAGHLGTALLSYPGFLRQGFNFVAVFDADPERIGTNAGELVVRDVSTLPKALGELDVDIGVLAVPSRSAQWVASLFSENGVNAILNFAPVSLWSAEDTAVSNVDLAVELEKLCYYLMAKKS
jgi:redox-sensing transcriptional repressor